MSRPTYAIPNLGDGYYAVADPDDPSRLTLWQVTGGIPRDWPKDTRWRPNPPDLSHIEDRDARAEARQRWYDSHYFPWREAVSAAIARDPEAARAAFVAAAGHQELPPRRATPPRERKRVAARPTAAEKRREEAALLAAALRAGGRSWRSVGRLLDLPKSTAHRLAAGREPVSVPDTITAALALVRVHDLTDEVRAAWRTADPTARAELDQRLAELARLEDAIRKRIPQAGIR